MNVELPHDVIVAHGSHSRFEQGSCALEWVDYLSRHQRGVPVAPSDKLTDSPACTCPVIAAFVRSWNDGIQDDATRTRLLAPLLPLLLDTRSTPEVESRRAWMATDWFMREHTATWLELAKLDSHAAAIRALPELCDKASAEAAMPVIQAARKASAAAWVAASAAAWVAASAAAWDAASAAAWAAARAAAWVAASAAAWDAASAAAWVAASAAAWDAASAAAWAAARAAAWDAASDAASDAAWVAARAAAWDAFAPTVERIQASAQDLVRRLCAVGKP